MMTRWNPAWADRCAVPPPLPPRYSHFFRLIGGLLGLALLPPAPALAMPGGEAPRIAIVERAAPPDALRHNRPSLSYAAAPALAALHGTLSGAEGVWRIVTGSPPPSPEVLAAILAASALTGLDPALLLAIARDESDFRPDARSPLSTATGLFQFIERTWLDAWARFGEAIPLAARPRLRGAILELRRDPWAASAMAALTIRDGVAELERRLGRRLRLGEAFLPHFLGLAAAERLLRAVETEPHRDMSDDLARAIRLNRPRFSVALTHFSARAVHAALVGPIEDMAVRYRIALALAGALGGSTEPFALVAQREP